ncbi:MAG TPA: helix-turn-helix domain-containing protein [Mycobacteriales bacterium]|jgi:predicted ATPase/DNA-binding XRE family transcriptional regulator|nr:helix-turn-helix domain-containing protein [Mycobacteriales bacterium]
MAASNDADPPDEDFGARLRALREAAGLTQEELAERAGLTSYAVSALERGRRRRPYPHTVRALAQALGLQEQQRAELLRAVPPRGGATAPAGPAGALPAGLPALPVATTRLVGRDEETRELAGLLQEGRRLVTLTGTGGVGKTRLAMAVVERVAASFADGVAVLSLAPLSDPAGVLPAIARAVGSSGEDGPDPAAQLVEHLRARRFLLVLDNLEHLLGAAPAIAALVGACPGLVVLATSRAPLRVRGETEHPVSPLAVPPAEAAEPAEAEDYPAVEVFVDRARAVSPQFRVTAANADAVAALCRRLAGIPLALELAAARIRFLDPAALLDRLDEAMARAGGPDLPVRQRTMRAAFDWSYDLLTPAEQRLLRVLAVFSGGCGLDAVEAVASAAGADGSVLPLLEVLVEHSLVVAATDGEGRPRFGLLEPVAQYARSRTADEESGRLRAAHAACYLAFAERAAPEYQAAEQVTWLDRAEREDANLIAALTWLLQAGDGERAGRLAWALWLYWWLRGRSVVGRRLAEQAPALDMSPLVRTRTLLATACMCFATGDVPAADRYWRDGRELAAAGPDEVAKGQTSAGVGLAALARGDLDLAEECFVRALPHLDGQGLYGDWMQSLTWVWLGTVQLLRGDVDAAVLPMLRGLDSARRRGDRLTAYVALYNLSQASIAQGRHDEARQHLSEGIRLTDETGDLPNLVYLLESLAVVEAAEGEAHRVAVLLGAAEAVRESVGPHVYGYYKPDEALRERAAAAAQAALGEDVYGDSLDAGRSLTPDEAIGYALTCSRVPAP